MRVGIGLASTIPGTPARRIVEWAQRVDEGPFSSLAVVDRIVYPNLDPLVSLSAAAAVTHRVRLMTAILIAPLRNATLLAKALASVDALAEGRLTLGLAVGGREDDFQAVGVPLKGRGRHFEQQLETMTGIWAGRSPVEGVPAPGPTPVSPGGPEILIGGATPAAIKRVGKWGNGYLAGARGPDTARKNYEIALQAWRDAGRTGKPRFVALLYFALGPGASEKAQSYIKGYYAFRGPAAEPMARAVPTTPEALQTLMRAYEQAGIDELMLLPCASSLDQVDRLADLIR